MFKTLRSSLYAIGFTAAAAILAVLAFALWSFDSLGRSAAQAQASSAVVANVLPPPLYLIETRLVLSQVAEGSLSVAAGRAEVARLAAEHRRELASGVTHSAAELQPVIAGDVARTSAALFAAADRLLTALERGDTPSAKAELARVNTVYTEHRKAIDAVVVAARGLERQAVRSFAGTRHNGAWILIVTSLAFLLAAMLSYARALRSILTPVQDCAALAHRVAGGDLSVPPPSARADELGALQNALVRMTASLSAARDGLVRARDKAERAGRAKADFLANMSHEIRTPLNAVLGLTHLLRGTALDDRQRDYLDKIQSSGRTLLRLINDTLDFSKVEAGKLALEAAPFELDRLFDDIAATLDTLIADKPVELIVQRGLDVPNLLLGDALRLQQVLLNLAANAAKFTAQGEICLSVQRDDTAPDAPRLRFEVRDTGPGIAPDVQQHLFQAFTQADTSTTRTHGGTGLGLAISQRLVTLMGGQITLHSVPGEGSRFGFSLPLVQPATPPEQARQAIERASSAGHALAGLGALVVDDNPTARLTMGAMLRSLGLDVREAASGPEALQQAQAFQAQGRSFAVALVDWRLPGMDGFEVIAALRNTAALSSACFIMVSAHDRDAVQAAMPPHRLDGLLQKPVTPSTLLDTLYGVMLGADLIRRPEPEAWQPDSVRLQGHVLLVEDNDINQLVAVGLLEAFGLQVDIAADGAQALQMAAGRRFDAVLMDVQMPGMDGFEATALLRRLPGHADTAVIAMTANSMPGERERCLAAGMSDYVAKPIEPELLANCLRRWLAP